MLNMSVSAQLGLLLLPVIPVVNKVDVARISMSIGNHIDIDVEEVDSSLQKTLPASRSDNGSTSEREKLKQQWHHHNYKRRRRRRTTTTTTRLFSGAKGKP